MKRNNQLLGMRKIALWVAGMIAIGVILFLLVWPDKTGWFTMLLMLLASMLGYFDVRERKQT